MARFLGAVQGSRGEATRLGGTSSGIRAQAQGWGLGVKVYGDAKPLDPERDMFGVWATSGSNGAESPKLIGTLQVTEDGRRVFTLSDDLKAALGADFQTANI